MRLQTQEMCKTSAGSPLGAFTAEYWSRSESQIYTCRSLKIFGLMCHHSEKLVQLTRVILHETRQHQLSRFILYFATGASVDYFYKVGSFLSIPLTVHVLSIADSTIVFARNRPALLTSRSPFPFCPDANVEFVRKLLLDCRSTFVASGY